LQDLLSQRSLSLETSGLYRGLILYASWITSANPGGAIGKAFYPPLQSECSKATLAVLFSQILIIIGVVILAVGLIKIARGPKTGSNQTQKL